MSAPFFCNDSILALLALRLRWENIITPAERRIFLDRERRGELASELVAELEAIELKKKTK